jgi:hypothetical protein
VQPVHPVRHQRRAVDRGEWHLVVYYGDVGYWNGIVGIGRVRDQDIDVIERQPDGGEITIERA